jgi:hypothetical protein
LAKVRETGALLVMRTPEQSAVTLTPNVGRAAADASLMDRRLPPSDWVS